MVKLIQLSKEQEMVICNIANKRGCSEKDIINEAVKLAVLFDEIHSSGMDLFYGNKIDDKYFAIVGVIES